MKRLLYLFLLLLPTVLKAQDDVVNRIIYIGDAGEQNRRQGGVIMDAQSKILPGKTTVIYLGDNVYPTGMGLPGSKEEAATKEILRSQFLPMRSKGAPVYFIPGNHDWDRMGPKGLRKVKRAWEFIAEQKDSLLKAVPENGCPGPYEIKINDQLTILAFDSEWWVYIYSKYNPNADCDCQTEDEIVARFRELLAKNYGKVIMLADHHPFWSYGHHGGYYNLTDYFFPLTSVQQNLYIPLPGIGALYPLVRGTFSVTEDQGHPLYRTMISRIRSVFEDYPNTIYVAGHEHGIQFIKDSNQVQVVSGAGAKEAFVKKGKKALYAKTLPGYVTADFLKDKSIRFTYYATTDTVFKQVFTYTKPYLPAKPLPVSTAKPVTADSVIVQARPDLDQVSSMHRRLYGENYRKEWAAKVKLPVIRLSDFKGGLYPEKIGGTHEALSLRLRDTAGKEWLLSSIEQYPVVELPEQRRETFAKSWLYDAISGQYPYSSLVAPTLAKAVKVARTNAVIGWVSPDRRLGTYEDQFAGQVCLLEAVHGWHETDNTGLMLKQLDADNDNRVDTLEFFRARLLDWFMGDWDQQQDQWRWTNQLKGKTKYYNAVPSDHDQSFFINEGLVPKAAASKWLSPFLKGYGADKHVINYFFQNGRELDARFLSGISYEAWMQTAKQFQASLTDSVLNAALRRIPEGAYKIHHQKLLELMKRRRAELVEAADLYYHFFNKVVDVKATDVNELFVVKDTSNNDLTVSVYRRLPNGAISYPLFSKTFDHRVTKEVRIYAGKGQDSVYFRTEKALVKVRVIGGKGPKSFYAQTVNGHTKIYDKKDNSLFFGPAAAKVVKHFSDDSSTVAYIPVNPYNHTIPVISTGSDPDDGFWLNLGLKYIINGFRHNPGQVQEVGLMHSFDNNAYHFRYKGTWFNAINKADLELQASAFTPNSINFFGIGNETKFDNDKHFYRTRFDLAEAGANLRWHSADTSVSIRVGPTVQYYHFLNDAKDRLIDHPELIHQSDSTTIGKDRLHAGLTVIYIDDKRNNQLLPAWGIYIYLKFQQMFGLNSYSGNFFQFTPQVQLYKSVTTNSSFVISDKVGGGVTLGQTAYYQSMFLGGMNTLPGLRENRYAGRQMFYNLLEARQKINNFVPYILPGEWGISAGYGVGRVWDNQTPSKVWHNSAEAGFYFEPSGMALLQLRMGYSADGWYPSVTLKLNI